MGSAYFSFSCIIVEKEGKTGIIDYGSSSLFEIIKRLHERVNEFEPLTLVNKNQMKILLSPIKIVGLYSRNFELLRIRELSDKTENVPNSCRAHAGQILLRSEMLLRSLQKRRIIAAPNSGQENDQQIMQGYST